MQRTVDSPLHSDSPEELNTVNENVTTVQAPSF